MSTYLAEIELTDTFTPEFTALIPKQRILVNDLMNEGIIVNYSLAMDRSKLWVTFEARGLEDVYDVIRTFPLYDFMNPDVFELAFNDTIHSGFPELCLN